MQDLLLISLHRFPVCTEMHRCRTNKDTDAAFPKPVHSKLRSVIVADLAEAEDLEAVEVAQETAMVVAVAEGAEEEVEAKP